MFVILIVIVYFLEFLGEALGAIGSTEVLSVLKEYSSDPVTEVNLSNFLLEQILMSVL